MTDFLLYFFLPFVAYLVVGGFILSFMSDAFDPTDRWEECENPVVALLFWPVPVAVLVLFVVVCLPFAAVVAYLSREGKKP